MDIETSTQLDKKRDPIRLMQESSKPIESVIRTMLKDLAALKGRHPSTLSSKKIGLEAEQKRAVPPADLPVAKPSKEITSPSLLSRPSQPVITKPGVAKPTIPKPVVHKPSLPSEKIGELVKVKSLFKKNYLRIVTISLLAIFIIGGIGGIFYWWNYLRQTPSSPSVTHNQCQDFQCVSIEGEGTDQCQSNEDCQIAEPTVPESLIPVNETETIEIATNLDDSPIVEDSIIKGLESIAVKEQSSNSFKRVLIKLVNEETKKYADLDILLSDLEINIPDNIRQAIASSDVGGGNYTLFFYSQSEGNRMGIVIAMKENNLELVLKLWEENMEGDLNQLFLKKDVSAAFTDEFQDNTYQGTVIRYLNFPDPGLSIDYAVINNKLVITTSRESIYRAIDGL